MSECRPGFVGDKGRSGEGEQPRGDGGGRAGELPGAAGAARAAREARLVSPQNASAVTASPTAAAGEWPPAAPRASTGGWCGTAPAPRSRQVGPGPGGLSGERGVPRPR